MSQFITGEAVTIDLRVARLGSRLIAGIVDFSLQLTALMIMAWVAFRIVAPDNDALAATVYLLVVITVLVGYPVTAETVWKGRTLGKAAMGLRVVRDDGGPIRFRHALVRGLIGAVVERPGALLGIPAVISMLISEKSRRLGDLLAGTVVLQERIPRGTSAPVTMPPQLAYWATTLDLSSVEDALALAIRQFLGRVQDLSPAARERIGSQLAASVRAVVTPPPPPDTPGWAYLSAVLAERTARARRRFADAPAPWQPGAAPWQPGAWNAGSQHPGYQRPTAPDPLRPYPYPYPYLPEGQQVPPGQGPEDPASSATRLIEPVDKPAPGPFVPPA